MLYLSGAVKAEYQAAGLGFMLNPSMGNRLPSAAQFGLDNGVFGAFTKGRDHDVDGWLAWLDKQPREGCLFAVAPDAIGVGARASYDRSLPWCATIRAMGFPVAMVAQDGFEDLLGDVDWDAFDAIFIGGAPGVDEWKLSAGAERVVREAKRHGKWVHVGRVNSGRRTSLMAGWGADSVDGTYLCYTGAEGLDRVVSWTAPVLPLEWAA